MLKIDQNFVVRLIGAIANSPEEERDLFERGILSDSEAFEVGLALNGFELILKGNKDILTYVNGYTLETLSEKFADADFTQHFNVTARLSNDITYGGDPEKHYVEHSTWHLVLEDNKNPNTLVTLTVDSIHNESVRNVSHCEILFYPNLTHLEKQEITTAFAAQAFCYSLRSKEYHHMSHVLSKMTSPLIDEVAVIEQSKESIPIALASLFLAIRRSPAEQPVLPIAIAAVNWNITGDTTAIKIRDHEGQSTLAAFENGHLVSMEGQIDFEGVSPEARAIRLMYLYCHELAHETGQLTGEITQSKPAMSKALMKGVSRR